MRIREFQRRFLPVANVRQISDGSGAKRFAATVLRYNVLDDYQTVFLDGVFDDSLRTRMPRVVWAHDWAEPLGRYIDWENARDEFGTRLDLIGEFDDFDDVPRARQADSQLRSGTIDQFSVGFMPEEVIDTTIAVDGFSTLTVPGFARGRLDEVSLVLVGAVPGTQLLAVRSRPHIVVRDPMVPKELAVQVMLDYEAGTLDLADALMAIKNGVLPDGEADPETPPAGTDPQETPGDPPAGTEPTDTPDGSTGDTEGSEGTEVGVGDEETPPSDDEIAAEIDAALALVDSHGVF